MKQISPKFRRALESEIRRLMTQRLQEAGTGTLKADLVFSRDNRWRLTTPGANFPALEIQRSSGEYPPTANRIKWGLDTLTEWAFGHGNNYTKIEFGPGLRGQGLRGPILNRRREYGNLFGQRDTPTLGQQFRSEMKAARQEFPKLRAAVGQGNWAQAKRIIKSIASKIKGWDHRQYGSQNQYIKRRLALMVNAIAAQDARKAKGGLDDLEASLHSVF